MNLRRLTRLGALASASVLMLSAAGAVSAASVTPTFHEGNVGVEDCPTGSTGIKIDGKDSSGSAGGVTVTLTYHDGNTVVDFTATGGLVSIAFIKGGDNYNQYTYSPAVASDTNLISPPVGGDNQNTPAVSHTVFCVVPPPPPERHPDIHIEKTASLIAVNAPGGPVTYTFVVTNTGDVPLTSVDVDDDKCSPVTFVSGDTDGDDKLDLTESWTFTCTAQITVDTTNVAVATGHDGDTTVTDDDTVTVVIVGQQSNPVPAIHLEKTVAPLTLPVGGGNVTYTYVVSNIGDLALTNVAVKDDNGTPSNTADDFDVTCPKTELAIDEEMTCTADVSGTTQTTTNIATASGTAGEDTVTDTDDATVTVAPPGGGVEAETDVPAAPQTDTVGATADAGSSLPFLLVILGIIGLAAVLLTPRRARR
jgi:uncharacterized repeat protein (TIGR01451 family)